MANISAVVALLENVNRIGTVKGIVQNFEASKST